VLGGRGKINRGGVKLQITLRGRSGTGEGDRRKTGGADPGPGGGLGRGEGGSLSGVIGGETNVSKAEGKYLNTTQAARVQK